MSRPRKRDKNLPSYVRIRYGSYHYKNKKLCRVDEGVSKMYEELAKRVQPADSMAIPSAVAAFKLEYLPRLSRSAAKEHGRLLDVFAKEFADFQVADVEATDVKASIKNLFLGTGKLSAAKHYKARISTFFRWCIADKGWIKVNPCKEVWLDKAVPKRSGWTDELFWKVHEHLSPMHQLYHELSFLLYQRTTDIRLLTRSQCKADGIYFLPSKTTRSSGAAVVVPYTDAITDVLGRATKLTLKTGVLSPYVVHSSDGSPYTRSGIHSAYRRADIAIHGKTTGLSPKSLLPYAVTSAKKQGATLEQLKVGRAHTKVSTTEGYIQHHETPVSEVMLALPRKP